MRRNSKTRLHSLCVLGEWDRPYLTLRPEFEVKQLGIFGEMAKRGHIYKGLKTVYWCTTAKLHWQKQKSNMLRKNPSPFT